MKSNSLLSLMNTTYDGLSADEVQSQEEFCAGLTPFCPEIVELIKLKTHMQKPFAVKKSSYGFDEHEVWA